MFNYVSQMDTAVPPAEYRKGWPPRQMGVDQKTKAKGFRPNLLYSIEPGIPEEKASLPIRVLSLAPLPDPRK
jgi:hypothetical protein